MCVYTQTVIIIIIFFLFLFFWSNLIRILSYVKIIKKQFEKYELKQMIHIEHRNSTDIK